MGKDEAKVMSAKEKRQQKAREKGGAVAKKEKVVEHDEGAEAVAGATTQLKEMLVGSVSKSVADAAAAAARNVTGVLGSNPLSRI